MVVPRGMVKYIPEGGKAAPQGPEVTEPSHSTLAWLRLKGTLTFTSVQPPAMSGDTFYLRTPKETLNYLRGPFSYHE